MAALLHAAGHQVLLCGRTPRDQIEVRPDDERSDRGARPVHTDPADVDGPVDVVLLAVKDTQNQSAAGWLARLCDDRTVVCALQNGVEQVERVGPLCPSSEVVPASCGSPPRPHPEGWVRLRTGVRLVLPETAGARQARGARCATPRSTVELDPDFVTAAWRKLLVNARRRLMVLTGRRSGMFRRDDVAALSRRYLAECLAVARAEGADLGDDVVDEIVGLFAEGARGHDDVDAHRPRGTPAAGVGHPQRRDLAQGRRPRAGHPDQRRPGAAAGRGERRPRVDSVLYRVWP